MGTKKARPTEATAEQVWQETACEARLSFVNSTTGDEGSQPLRVSDFLGTGEQDGKTMRELRQSLNDDPRKIRLRIERERRDAPILSGKTGYYLPACESEVRQFCSSMRRRARAIWTSAANVERAAGISRKEPQQLDGQGCIWAGGDSDG